MILIVSFTDNEHVDEVRKHIASRHVVVDVTWFPSRMQLTAAAEEDRMRIQLTPTSGETIDLADVGAVWYRRVGPYGLHPELVDGTSRIFSWSECNEALLGVWYTLPCFWMNPPLGDEVAQRKIHQIRLAQLVGLHVPETLVTNDPQQARIFIERFGPGSVIRKAFRNIPEAPRQTTMVGESELGLLDSVRYAPVIFQRFVPAEVDLRVTIVDDEIFVAEIRSDAHNQVDYRPGLGTASVKSTSLPDEISDQLLQLVKHMGVTFGAIDMRLTSEGEYIFLEINPAGEYLFISRRAELPIPEAIAAALQRHDAER